MLGRFERFSFALSSLYRYWHKIVAEEMEKFGLKGTYAIYLVALYHHDEGLTAAELCALCGKDKSDASRVVALMEHKGLVLKEGVNQYRAKLKLSEAGRRAAEQVLDRARLAVALGGHGISEEDRGIFYTCLEQIAANLRRLSEEGIPESKGEL